MLRLNGFHLPALKRPPLTTWPYGGHAPLAAELRVPHLTPALLDRQIDDLLRARSEYLARKPLQEIVRAIDQVATRFRDPTDSIRRAAEHGLAAVTAMSTQMIAAIIDGMASDWRTEPLQMLLKAELGDPEVLDRFVERRDVPGRTRAFGPELVVHIFSGNVPGVSVTSLVRALLVKAASLGKTAAGEPVLAPLFAQALAEVDPQLGRCVAITYWPGGEEALESRALQRASAVVGYGGRETIGSLRRRTPAEVPFIGYGHKVSFAVMCREAIACGERVELARAAALAVATFDQQGCVSPHLIYVESDDEKAIREWSGLLAAEMAALEQNMPRGALAPGEASAIRQLRGEIEFAQISGRGHQLFTSGAGTAWTVIFDPEPGFVPSCLNRVVRVKPVTSLTEVVDQVRPMSGLLQTVGFEGPEERLEWFAGEMGRLGASRIAPLSTMVWPAPWWHHDGRPPLADLLRWCDLH